MPKLLRSCIFFAALAVLLSACQMEVRFVTHVDGDGSGTFRIQLSADKEFLDGWKTNQALAGTTLSLDQVSAYFDCLGNHGWQAARAEPNGGLLLSASRKFASRASFKDAAASTGCEGSLNLSYRIDYREHRSLLWTRWSVDGAIDLRGGPKQGDKLGELLGLAGRFASLRIVAEMPGAITVAKGTGGVVSDGSVAWEPRLGGNLEFAATASRLNTVPVLLIAIPSILVLGLGIWLVSGRRRRSPPPMGEGPAPEEVRP